MQTHVHLIGILPVIFSLFLLILMFSFSLIWIEVDYTVDCFLLEKFESDIWYESTFSIENKVKVIGHVNSNDQQCNLVLRGSILTHIINGFTGLDYEPDILKQGEEKQ